MNSIALTMTTVLFLSPASFALDDPRMAIDSVRGCVTQVKEFLRSDEYQTDDQNLEIIKACRDTEASCVQEVGSSLSSFERGKAEGFLPLVKRCSGKGTGQCFKAIADKTASYDRNDLVEVDAMLKRCE